MYFKNEKCGMKSIHPDIYCCEYNGFALLGRSSNLLKMCQISIDPLKRGPYWGLIVREITMFLQTKFKF